MNTEKYIIRDGIPPEAPRAKLYRESKYPVVHLELNQSFTFPIEEIANIRSAATVVRKRYNRKFRICMYDRFNGICWRIA